MRAVIFLLTTWLHSNTGTILPFIYIIFGWVSILVEPISKLPLTCICATTEDQPGYWKYFTNCQQSLFMQTH
jgi:hypothetical protein